MPKTIQLKKDANVLLKEITLAPGIPVVRQLADHVRILIRAGTLPPLTRMPPLRKLAAAWGTNYFTAQNAMKQLVREGLLVQASRLGSYVADQKRSLQQVCLYHGDDFELHGRCEFNSRLHLQLHKMISEQSISTMSYFDRRPLEERDIPPPVLQDMITERRLDAIISTACPPTWFARLDIPSAATRPPRPRHGGVSWDREHFFKLALKAVADNGRKRVCILDFSSAKRFDSPGEQKLTRSIARIAADLQLELVDSPPVDRVLPDVGVEAAGYRLCEAALAIQPRPDALIIIPDVYTKGATHALLQSGLRLPDDIMLVSHRNHEMRFFTPLPVTWITVKISDFAHALLDQIKQQIEGNPPAPVDVVISVETTDDRQGSLVAIDEQQAVECLRA